MPLHDSVINARADDLRRRARDLLRNPQTDFDAIIQEVEYAGKGIIEFRERFPSSPLKLTV